MPTPLRVLVLVVVLVTLIALLAATRPEQPLLGAGSSTDQEAPWISWVKSAAPYAIVAVLGLFVGLSELVSTFPNYPVEAVVSAWGLVLLGINAGTSAIAFAIARYYVSAEERLFVLILAAGIGFQSIIRTRFVLAKEFGGGGNDLSLNLGWLYEQFQSLCKTQIDLSLMRNRESSIRHLLTRYPDEKQLYNLAYYTIKARGTLSAEEERAALAELDKTMAQTGLPYEIVQTNLALMILEVGGQTFADILCSVTECRPGGQKIESAAVNFSPDNLVGQLVETYDLNGLAALAGQAVMLVPATENRSALQNFIQGTAEDKGATEQFRKTILARFVVEKAGVVFAEKAVRNSTPAGTDGKN